MDKSIVPVNKIATRSSTCYEFSNPNGAEVVEIEDDDASVETVEKQMEYLKLNYQFNEKDVPQIFQTFINSRISDLKEMNLGLAGSTALLVLDDKYIRFEKMNDDGMITYIGYSTTIKTVDPEKSIVDHLWFLLKNPNIKLEKFGIFDCENSKAESRQILDLEILTTLLQSMLNSIDQQIQTNAFGCDVFNEDMFLSMLKKVKPETLREIILDISWKEEGNYQKMKEIVETDQWKQAEMIHSHRVTPSKIDEFFQYKSFCLQLDNFTPEDVLLVVEHAFKASCPKRCGLYCGNENFDIDAIIDFLRLHSDRSRITKAKTTDPQFQFGYAIIDFGKRVQLDGNENFIVISNK